MEVAAGHQSGTAPAVELETKENNMSTKIRRVLIGGIIIAVIGIMSAVVKIGYNQNVIKTELIKSGMVDPGKFK